MKIIINNVKPIPDSFPKRFSCQFCTSEIEVESQAEIENIAVSHPMEKGLDQIFIGIGFTCPACNKKNIIG